MKSINKLIEATRNYVSSSYVIVIIKLNKEKVSSRFYEVINNEQISFRPKPKEYREFTDEIYEHYNLLISTDDKFNSAIIEFNQDGTYSEKYFWDSEQEKQDLLSGSEVFFQWANDRMMSMIFEYEKDNNLLPTQYDNDGDLEYLSSWDRGVFTFYINENNELEYKIVLIKDGVERVLKMPLKDYFIEGVLEHHKITNNELLDVWKPWNTLIIRSPHTGIPYDKVDEYVEYKTVMS
ncbi:hypothetical protein INQ45_00765 [Flavobacterium columnare]|uniref:hypothetical protein n=1 Tax=Flavobacterium columnare TaxID=996 RepID=UPI002D207B30|nr:hypothetical protein [Flavobacterium columnare]MEB3799668.1 hypothetical protein [Flavobacterium columnare]